MIRICYPENRWVTEEQIIAWATADKLASDREDATEPVENLEEAINILNDSGTVTVTTDRR